MQVLFLCLVSKKCPKLPWTTFDYFTLCTSTPARGGHWGDLNQCNSVHISLALLI